MHFRQKLENKEKWVYILYLAKIWSEITILVGMLIVIWILIKQFL